MVYTFNVLCCTELEQVVPLVRADKEQYLHIWFATSTLYTFLSYTMVPKSAQPSDLYTIVAPCRMFISKMAISSNGSYKEKK